MVFVFLSGSGLFGPGLATSLRAEDCNRNGVEDAVDISAGTSTDCDGSGIPDECEVAPIQYTIREPNVVVRRYPRAIRIADVSGDGLPDILCANRDPSSTVSMVSVVLGSEDGRFDLEGSRTDYDDALRVSALDVSDLDGDGDLDILTANFFTLEILWNDGLGVFEQSTSIEVERSTRYAHAADVNRDGLPDVIASNTASDEVTVRINLGGGTFANPVAYFVGTYPTVVRSADLDDDTDLDLLVVNQDSGDVSILVNDGSGVFSDSARISIGPSMLLDLAVGDLDLDGLPDFVAANEEGAFLRLNDAAGGFGEPIVFPGGVGALGLADLEGDGDIDLVLGSIDHSYVTVVVNVGGQYFLRPENHDTNFTPAMLEVGDLDGDSDADILLGSSRTVRLTRLYNNDQSALVIERVRVGMSAAPHSSVVGDLDDDGYLDFLTGDGLGSTLTIFLNDQSGNLVLNNARTVRANDYLNSVDVGDFDGDGDLDAVTGAIQSNRMQVFFNDGDARFGGRRLFPTGVRPFMVEVADLNGDGFPEIFSANETSGSVTVYLNTGDGTGGFGNRRNYSVGRQPTAVAAGDLDGDNQPEIVSANRGSRNFSVLMNNGDGSFANAQNVRVNGDPWYLGIGDFDSDGDLDVVCANLSRRSVEIFANRGDATFEAGVEYPVNASPYSLTVFDMNVDGVPDIFTANQNNDNVSVLLNRGDGSFHPGVVYPAGDAPRFANPGDLDNDGDVDFIAANHDGRDIHVFYNRSPIESRETHLEEICTELEFHDLSTLSRRGRDLKFVLPVDPAAPGTLPPLFQNGRIFDLHQDFLTAVFPDRFPILTQDEYNRLVGLRETRQHFIGALTRISTDIGAVYGFSVFTDISRDARELLGLDEVRGIYEQLTQVFHLETVAYLPDGIPARERAAEWADPGFPIVFDSSLSGGGYEAYTQAVGYGTVRILDEASFAEANETGRINFREILVLDHAPRDIEGVVGGVVTAVPQGPLSHLSVRTARRGTPNCHVEGAVSAFTAFDGQLVRLEVLDDEFLVDPATLQEAETFWEGNRPRLSEEPTLDEDFAVLTRLRDIDLSVPGVAESRFGGKATNFARLQRVLGAEFSEYQEVGFAIPVRHYLEFVRSNRTLSFVTPLTIVTYEEYLDELFASEEFRSDSAFRFRALAQLRDAMEDSGEVPADLVSGVVGTIDSVFGTTTDRVRFRSSSNIEDALEFNGAGLYSSLSGCAADDQDDDDDGPSRCGDSDDERDVARAIRRVWASLWNFRAFEEREYYQIPQDVAAMGILVSRAFVDELANGVVFTGNPQNPLDGRYLVAGQVGETSVVSPDPGILPARDVLFVEDGELLEILRASRSTLLPDGTNVLSEEELAELSRVLFHIEQNFPIDLGKHDRADVVLDLEFKIQSNGSLAIKQVRPFLRSESVPPSPSFELQLAAGVVTCAGYGSVSIARAPEDVLALKTLVSFLPGAHSLPTNSVVSKLDLIESVRFGPDARLLESLRPGILRATRLNNRDGTTRHLFTFDQVFAVDGERRLTLRFVINDTFTARDDNPIRGALVFNELFVEDGLAFDGEVSSAVNPDQRVFLDFSSCIYESLDLWEMAMELEDGSSLAVYERYRPFEGTEVFGPVRLEQAFVNLRGARRSADAYWDLVYAAARHNTFARRWVVLDPPLTLAGVDDPVHVIEAVSPQRDGEGELAVAAGARYLREDFTEIVFVPAVSYSHQIYVPPEEPPFRRGDTDASGVIELTDAVSLLNFLFSGGDAPPCENAADADDDGVVGLNDAVRILGHLFRGLEELPPPFAACDVDRTEDGLACRAFGPCE